MACVQQDTPNAQATRSDCGVYIAPASEERRRSNTMSKYVLLYTAVGGQATVAPTPEEQQASMAAWNAWFAGMGEKVVDAGNPFGPSKTIATDGTASDGAASRVTGY